ncbi:hypothetical protein PT285_02310 [Lactobacillus sp. ESL0791]|uniref:hypothetical protein n=1 Tax=Lactobacillus sp. ESL0791 TaxID=2983234 RepID=UPI0023F91E4A|nr:hypothetical protein [Lactobacillus sp. ESL0791]MDF7638267.1 hypothetical protein [Lactobacillus sp. ESL0791]
MTKNFNNTIYFYLMTDRFFSDFSNYDEFERKSNRGHGVISFAINNELLAIPLRSSLSPKLINARHLFPYKVYQKANGNKYLKALDLSKLMFIKEYHVNQTIEYFFQDPNEKQFYIKNINRIYTRTKNYIGTYIKICNKIDQGKEIQKYELKKYRYSTLRNFHSKLGIPISKQAFIEALKNNNY